MSARLSVDEAESILGVLAESFLSISQDFPSPTSPLSVQPPANLEGPDYESRYKALVEHIPGIIFVAPLQFGSGDAYVSPQIETILGFKQDEWLGDPLRWYQQVHPEDKQRWSVEAATLFASGKPLSSSYRVIARDGRVVWFQCEARMVHSGGKPSFIHGIGFDVTELKEAEASLTRARDELESRIAVRTQDLARTNAELEKTIAGHQQTELLLIAAKEAAEASARVKSEFMANMSHEIRTPMNGVLGLTSLVLNTDLNAQQREYLSRAQSSAESLLEIINEVLDFSKLESNKVEINPAGFRLRSSMETLIGELKWHAEQKGLSLVHQIASETPDFVVGDLVRLRQVLINLINNAIKFTPDGQVRLKIAPDRAYRADRDQNCTLHFSVADTGIGIPPAMQQLIFEPFAQADGSITRKYGGTGLGLSISKRLVEMMGGRIGVVSVQGAGSTFSFTVAFTISEEGAQGEKAKSGADLNRRQLRILIAEDNLVNQLVVAGVLEQLGHSLTVVANGREAVDAYRNSVFELILMDVQMPLMDGLAATQAIRNLEAQESMVAVPIIGLSAHAMEKDRARCIEAGMDEYLSKPFKGRDLLALIDRLTIPSV